MRMFARAASEYHLCRDVKAGKIARMVKTRHAAVATIAPNPRVRGRLELMGARISSVDGHAPLTIHGGRLRAIAHRPDLPSAQVKSAVLLAGLLGEGTTAVTEPSPTRDHTERALEAFGATVDR